MSVPSTLCERVGVSVPSILCEKVRMSFASTLRVRVRVSVLTSLYEWKQVFGSTCTLHSECLSVSES